MSINLMKQSDQEELRVVNPVKIRLPTVNERIPDLVRQLEKISTQSASERQYIGEAISYLRLLQDLTK
jgi:hypothetical protein